LGTPLHGTPGKASRSVAPASEGAVELQPHGEGSETQSHETLQACEPVQRRAACASTVVGHAGNGVRAEAHELSGENVPKVAKEKPEMSWPGGQARLAEVPSGAKPHVVSAALVAVTLVAADAAPADASAR
jgi:hypothetical protein